MDRAYCRRRWLTLLAAALTSALVSVAAPTAATAGPTAAGTTGSAIARGAFLDGSPGTPVADERTDTVYVPIQCATAGCADGAAGHVVDVIDGRTCTAAHPTGCAVAGRVRVGASPLAAAIDPRTNTLYVANAGVPGPAAQPSLSVVDIGHCRARLTTGCGAAVATVPIGGFVVAVAVDDRSGTVYLASPDGHAFVVDARHCNARSQTGCAEPVGDIPSRAGTDALVADSASHTLYTVSAGDDPTADTMAVVDTTHCDGADHSGCTRPPRLVGVGGAPFWVTLDPQTHTVYTANDTDGSVSVVDAGRCNARTPARCPTRAASIATGARTDFVAVDPLVHTVFAVNAGDDTLSAIDTRACRGPSPASCPTMARTGLAAPNEGAKYVGFPSGFALLPDRASIYLVGIGGATTLNVISANGCNAVTTGGCRDDAPAVSLPGAARIIDDPDTHTVYVSVSDGTLGWSGIDVLDGRHCNAARRGGCTPIASIPVPNASLGLDAIDPGTDTLYASDVAGGGVEVVDLNACHAGRTSGCGSAHVGHVKPGAGLRSVALNPRTHTLYAVYGSFDGTPHHVAVIDTTHCNARSTSGCARSVRSTVPVPAFATQAAVSPRTDTVYVSVPGPNFDGTTAFLIDGRHCNAHVQSACAGPQAMIRTGVGPIGITVDDRRHVVYIADNADGDAPGTVTVLDSRTCNAGDTSGCGRAHPVIGVGRSPELVASDPATGTVYVVDFASAGVSVVPGAIGAACAVGHRSACRRAGHLQPVGSEPSAVAVDPTLHTVYATFFASGRPGLSIFPT